MYVHMEVECVNRGGQYHTSIWKLSVLTAEVRFVCNDPVGPKLCMLVVNG